MLRNIVQNVLLFLRVRPAHGERDDLGACMFHCRPDQFHGIFSGTQNKTGSKFLSSQYKGIVFHITYPLFLLL